LRRADTGESDTAVTVWDIAKWPVLLVIVSFMFRPALLGGAERQAPEVPLGELGRAARGPRARAELNAELERGRAIEAGHPDHIEPFVEPRDTRKLDDYENRA